MSNIKIMSNYLPSDTNIIPSINEIIHFRSPRRIIPLFADGSNEQERTGTDQAKKKQKKKAEEEQKENGIEEKASGDQSQVFDLESD